MKIISIILAHLTDLDDLAKAYLKKADNALYDASKLEDRAMAAYDLGMARVVAIEARILARVYKVATFIEEKLDAMTDRAYAKEAEYLAKASERRAQAERLNGIAAKLAEITKG